MLRSPCKVFLSSHYVCSIIYNYKCQSEAEYMRRTIQSLVTKIDQYVPAKIPHGRCDNLHNLVNTFDSAIVEHLISNPMYTMSHTRVSLNNPQSAFRLSFENFGDIMH